MVDNFMSGWGQAEGLVNIYLVECDTERQAECIEKSAKNRGEMSRVQFHHNEPHWPKATHLVSNKHFTDLGGVWTENY